MKIKNEEKEKNIQAAPARNCSEQQFRPVLHRQCHKIKSSHLGRTQKQAHSRDEYENGKYETPNYVQSHKETQIDAHRCDMSLFQQHLNLTVCFVFPQQ